MLQEEIAHAIRAAVLDGEIVCLAADGRSKFYDLMFRREWPHFIAFEVHSIEGEDLPARPLLERKRWLCGIMPRIDTRLLYHDHVDRRGAELFDAVCRGARSSFTDCLMVFTSSCVAWISVRASTTFVLIVSSLASAMSSSPLMASRSSDDVGASVPVEQAARRLAEIAG
jgi:hypothetical protein